MGKDTSDLFPDVVMNVVCQSLELKKVLYYYCYTLGRAIAHLQPAARVYLSATVRRGEIRCCSIINQHLPEGYGALEPADPCTGASCYIWPGASGVALHMHTLTLIYESLSWWGANR